MVNIQKLQGFTLIELMITLVVAAILLSLSVPSFQTTIRNSRTVTNANQLIATLHLAKSEAIKRGLQVSIRHKGTTDNVWEGGWDIFADVNADGSFNDDGDTNLCETGEDCLIKTTSFLSNGYTLRTTNYAEWMAYLANGMPASIGLTNDTFRLCDDLADTTTSKAIIVNRTGRVRTQTTTASCP